MPIADPIADLADSIARSLGGMAESAHEALFEPVIRLGVTGLARAGKTVFITSLVANLMNRARMPGLVAAAEGRIQAAFLEPQPDLAVPRFDYEAHLAALTGPDPHWPESTRAVSQLRLSFRVSPGGLLSGWRRPRIVHLDIVDYPGEWLLDLALIEQDYAAWSETVLERMGRRAATLAGEPAGQAATRALAALTGTDAAQPLDETQLIALSRDYTTWLEAARDAGLKDLTPGRFLMPGELAGSPLLTFAPLMRPTKAPRGSLWREMERRYEAYKAQVVRPFFRQHFARIDRQVVLMDVLGAIAQGPVALDDLRAGLAETLRAFRPGQTGLIGALLGRHRVDRILFAATKADHLHHTQHPRLTAIAEALVREARDRADFAGAETRAMAIAALRATTEETIEHEGRKLDCVRGILEGSGKSVALYPGELPEDPAQLLAPARKGAARWLDGDWKIMRFAPAPLSLRPGEGPPHIRLDRAAEFLIGDRL